MIYGKGPNVHDLVDAYDQVQTDLNKVDTLELVEMYPRLKRQNNLDNALIYGGYAAGIGTAVAAGILRDTFDVQGWTEYAIEGGGYTMLVAGAYMIKRVCFGDGIETSWQKSAIEEILEEREKTPLND